MIFHRNSPEAEVSAYLAGQNCPKRKIASEPPLLIWPRTGTRATLYYFKKNVDAFRFSATTIGRENHWPMPSVINHVTSRGDMSDDRYAADC